MKQKVMLSTLAKVMILLFLFGDNVGCTVVNHKSPEEKNLSGTQVSQGGFDASTYVKGLWEKKIVPEVLQNSIELSAVLKGLMSDPESTRTKWGRRKEDSAPYAFLVKGIFKILSANTESAASTIELDTSKLAPKTTVKIQIGPVFTTSSVRDALTFVSFGDFTNQVDFANVAKAINFQIRDSVVNNFPRENLVGKFVKFEGAYLEDSGGTILITPVFIEIQK